MRSRAMVVGWLLVLLAMAAPRAEAQQGTTGFFTDPILVFGPNGHNAPVRSMVFAADDGSQLLTGGMDKVVHVWNLDVDRSGPARTLRPPNWRGLRGRINALALSPPDPTGRRILAVAGYGTLGGMGEILLFRAPDANDQGTGEIIGQLASIPARDGRPEIPGHTNAVTSIAFTTDGRFLASASLDKTVRLWDVEGRRQVAVLSPQEAVTELNALAVFANGTRLVTGGNDGVVRLYDIADRTRIRLLAQSRLPVPNIRGVADPASVQMVSLGVSGDGQWLVVGTEGGGIIRYAAATLANPVYLPPSPGADQVNGAVLALAVSRDGTRLATSMVERLLPAPDSLPSLNCVVRIHAMPDGRILETLPTTSNLVQALAFSPDGRRLAYSGGDGQSIFVKDFGPGALAAPDEIPGSGSSVRDVAFRSDNNAVRFARSKPTADRPVVVYEYFDLRGRFFFNPPANELPYRSATMSEAGWTITPIDRHRFAFRNAQGQGYDRSLDPTNERRWWAYTVIPPGPGHPQPVAAVAAEAGVVLWNLITGEKTRFFNGHIGAVYALASSPDGKWLVTGSVDQTVRLWPLAGCDRTPPLGARFDRRADGAWVVGEVAEGGFAQGVGLKAGHVVEKLFVSDYDPVRELTAPEKDALLGRIDLESPTKMFTFNVRMPGEAEPLLVATTRRDSPALSLFPAVDRRWVLWTPRGYYDSSADGDRKFLGWLTNRGTLLRLLAGSFDSIDKFEGRYRQRKGPGNAIDALLDSGDPLKAVPPPPVVAADPAAPPLPDPRTSRVDVLAIVPAGPAARPVGPVAVGTATLPVLYRAVASAGAAPIRQLWVEINGRRLPDRLDPAVPSTTVEGPINLPIGRERELRAILVAVDTLGVRRVQALDLTNVAPPPPVAPVEARKPRLEVVAIGAETFADKRFPRIPFAERDAKDLGGFLRQRLADPSTRTRFAPEQVQVHPFLGGEVARARLTATLDDLKSSASAGKFGEGDVLAVVVESHYLDFQSAKQLATAEGAAPGEQPPTLSADDLTSRLGDLARSGCRVVVLLDAVHEVATPGWSTDIQEWARQLQAQARVVVFLAADHGPSSPNGEGHRIFAQGILDVLKVKNANRLRPIGGGAMSLFDFQRTVTDSVLLKTGRKQQAQCLLPDSISPQVPFLDPSP